MIRKIKNREGKISLKIIYTIISLVALIVLGFLNPWLMALVAVIVVFIFSRRR